MKWPWSAKSKHRAEQESLRQIAEKEREIEQARSAAEDACDREQQARLLRLEVETVTRRSRLLADENHFGEMIDAALGVPMKRRA